MYNYNPIKLAGKSRSIHAKDWMFDFCTHHGINSKVLPFLINYIIYYCDKNYDILEASDNAPTMEDNSFELNTSVQALCDAMMGLASRSRMQDTFLPALEKTKFIELKESSKKGRTYLVNFDILNEYLETTCCYKKNNRLLQKEQQGCYKKNNNTLYIKDYKEEKGQFDNFDEKETDTDAGIDPDVLGYEIESVINKNRKVERARRKVIADNPSLNIDDFRKTFIHWLVMEYKDFKLYDDGRGLEKLMITHAEFLVSNGSSSSFKSVSPGYGKQKADDTVEWMMENAGDLQMDEYGCRYMFNANGTPRDSELFFKEKEEIKKGIRSGIINEDHLRFYCAYVLVRKSWPDYNHSYFFCEYDFGDHGSIAKYRSMMKSLSRYIAGMEGDGNFIKLAKTVYDQFR